MGTQTYKELYPDRIGQLCLAKHILVLYIMRCNCVYILCTVNVANYRYSRKKEQEGVTLSACDCFTSHVKWEAQAALSCDLYGYAVHIQSLAAAERERGRGCGPVNGSSERITACAVHTHTHAACVPAAVDDIAGLFHKLLLS